MIVPRRDRPSCKRQVTPSTAIQVGYNRLGQCSSRSRSVISGHILIGSNNFRSPTRRARTLRCKCRARRPYQPFSYAAHPVARKGVTSPADYRLLAGLARRSPLTLCSGRRGREFKFTRSAATPTLDPPSATLGFGTCEKDWAK